MAARPGGSGRGPAVARRRESPSTSSTRGPCSRAGRRGDRAAHCDRDDGRHDADARRDRDSSVTASGTTQVLQEVEHAPVKTHGSKAAGSGGGFAFEGEAGGDRRMSGMIDPQGRGDRIAAARARARIIYRARP